MEFVKIKKGSETKTVESGAVHLYAMRGWTVDKSEKKTADKTATTPNYTSSYTATNR